MKAGSHPGLQTFFEVAFEERIERSPQRLAAAGIKRHQDRLDDQSDAARQEEARLVADQLARLRAFDPAQLNEEDSLSYDMFAFEAKQFLEGHRFRHHHFLVNQKFGIHSDFPAFMINMHAVDKLADAHHYIARLHAFDRACSQVINELSHREELGVVPPAYLFAQMIEDCRAFIAAEPPESNILYQDFQTKLDKLDGVTAAERQAMLEAVTQALKQSVLPAYGRLADFLAEQQSRAPEQGGAWSLPDGEAFYDYCLRSETTTQLSAKEIHLLGQHEVARIHRELSALQAGLGIEGGLKELFRHARQHQDFYYPQTSAGRQHYLDDLRVAIDRMAERLPSLFTRMPEDALQVKPVEAHREKTAGLAFYQPPAADGSRPGIFHINLHDLGQLPAFATEALAFHEALPGHHMQFSIANHLHDLPSFRRFA